MLLNVSTVISIIIVFGFALLQFVLTLGAPFGEYVLGGYHKVLPIKMRFVSLFFTIVFSLVTLSYLQKSNTIYFYLNSSFVDTLLIIYTVFIGYAIIGNGLLTKSKKEKYVMTPISILGFLCSITFLFNT